MPTHRKLIAACALLGTLGFVQRVSTQAPAGQPAPNNSELGTLHVSGNVHLLVGAGGNIAVQTGDDGVLVVDTGLAQNADKVLAAIKKLSDKPIRWVLNTHFHPDHTGGNEALSKAGSKTNGGPAEILSHENVLTRMSASANKRSTGSWPTDTYFPEEKDIYFNGEAVMLYHDQAAHTDGDSIVFFRKSDVVMAGDTFVTTSYPFIDQANGGSIQGELNALNRILDIAVPAHEQEGGTFVIPGHGRVCDEADVLEYRDMVTIIRDRVRDLTKAGRSLAEIKAAQPAKGYMGRYGNPGGTWTTDRFIEAIFRSLSKGKS